MRIEIKSTPYEGIELETVIDGDKIETPEIEMICDFHLQFHKIQQLIERPLPSSDKEPF